MRGSMEHSLVCIEPLFGFLICLSWWEEGKKTKKWSKACRCVAVGEREYISVKEEEGGGGVIYFQ